MQGKYNLGLSKKRVITVSWPNGVEKRNNDEKSEEGDTEEATGKEVIMLS